MSESWPRFRGSLLLGDAARAYGADFGNMITTVPRAALRPACVDDVVAAVRYARAVGLRIVPRGQGHCTRGQAQRDDALVLDLRELDAIAEPVGGTVRVEAGALWADVVERVYASGLTPPVLTDYLDLTVGGTLSVGGVGGQSFRHGFQVDNVVQLEVVDGRGELVRCSATTQAGLFDACRGGLGEFGVVVAATLALVPAPARVRVRRLPYARLESFLAAQLALARAAAVDYLVGNFLPPTCLGPVDAWTLSLECVEYLGVETRPSLNLAATGARLAHAPPPEEIPYLTYATRLAAMAAAWRASGSWNHCHPWIDVFVPAATAPHLIASALADLDAARLGEGYVMTYPLLGDRLRAPAPGVPDVEELFLFDILPAVTTDARPDAERRCRRVFEAAMAAGATVYPIGYPFGTSAMGEDVLSRHSARRRADREAVREQHDPGGIMGTGQRRQRRC